MTLVKSVEYFMTNTFKDKLYDSCKNVYNPQTGTAIASMCGVWGPGKVFSRIFIFQYFGMVYYKPGRSR